MKNIPYNDIVKISSIKEIMELAAKEAGDKAAYKIPDKNSYKSVTFREFNDTVDFIGTALKSRGLTTGHIAIVGKNSYEWLTAYLTVLKSAGVVVPIDKELPFTDISNILINSDSEVLFYADEFEKDLLTAEFPKIKYFIGFDREEDDGRFLSYKKLIADGKALFENGDKSFLSETRDENLLKMLVYTSGTTGMAKGVMLSEHNLVSCIYNGLLIASVKGTGFSVLPYNHTYAAVVEILVSIHLHNTICINDSIRKIPKNMLLFKPDYMYIVPAYAEVFYKKIIATAKKQGKYKALMAMIKISNALLEIGIDVRRKLFKSVLDGLGGNIYKFVCGGAPVRSEIGDFFESIGVIFMNGYGITECSPLVSGNREGDSEPESVGVPIPCVEIKFDEVDSGGIGEICVKGDTVMLGYYKQPGLTKEVLSDDGWFKTGDFGKFNERGHLMITGRKKNLIVLKNGKNIYPEEIEEYILAIPYVSETVVTAVKDEDGNDASLCAHVFLNSDAVEQLGITNPAETVKKDISAATAHLPSYKHITSVVVRDTEFPKTTTRKIKRNLI